MTRLATILAVTFALFGCATGSALVTGQIRPAIEDHTVEAALEVNIHNHNAFAEMVWSV